MAKASHNIFVIGICGASCSGKTTVSREIMKRYNSNDDILVISQDNYYYGGNEDTNYDVPSAIDFDKLIQDVKNLIDDNEIDMPQYDFKTHSRRAETIRVRPKKYILVEGILIFYKKELRDLFNLKVYISSYGELCYYRRLKRDVEERGRSHQEVSERYFRDVLPASKTYVEPMIQFSDIALINNTEWQFVGLNILMDHLDKKLI
jgi:uridine kinase